jgi:hypothetical protein
MKRIWMRALMLILIGLCAGISIAQSLENTVTTDGGLSINYPASWSAEPSGATRVDVYNSDGWLVTILVGEEADYGGSGDAYAQPADIMQRFVEFMQLTGAEISKDGLQAIDIGIIASLQQIFITHTGVPFEAVAYTLPDGMSALAMVGNQTTSQPLTPDIRDVFYAILSSATFQAPAVVEQADVTGDEPYIPDGAVRISDLESGELRFSGGIETSYADGWQIYSEDPYIKYNASLIYGDSLFNYEAMLILNVQDSVDLTLETFRETTLPFSALLYTGRETFDPASDIITETLPDGRVIEYLDNSEAEAILGNVYTVQLDGRYWAWGMLTVLSADDADARSEEVLDLMRNMTLVISDDAFMYEGFQLTLQDATCERTLTLDDVNQNVPYAVFNCPAGCADEGYSVWGTDIYTLDSSICAAAIHAGAIFDADGGAVLATWMEGQESYAATEQNGIQTSDYGAWSDSFIIEPFTLSDGQ